MNILIIDDDPDDSLTLFEVIKEIRPDANCIIEHRCEELFFVNKKTPLDFIFLDSNMHPVGGKECLRKLIEMVDPAFTTIIVQSGVISPQDIEEFRALGADRVTTKSSTIGTLKEVVKEILDHPKSILRRKT